MTSSGIEYGLFAKREPSLTYESFTRRPFAPVGCKQISFLDNRLRIVFDTLINAASFLGLVNEINERSVISSLNIPCLPDVLPSASVYARVMDEDIHLKTWKNIELVRIGTDPSSPATSTDTEPSSSGSRQSGDLSPSVSSESSQSNRSDSPMVVSTLSSIPEELEEEQKSFVIWHV